MKLIAILGLFIVSACATQPQHPPQAGQQPWQRNVAQSGLVPTSNATVSASSRKVKLSSVDIEIDTENCATGCAYTVINKNAHILWPNIEQDMSKDGFFVSLNTYASANGALYNSTAPAHIVVHASFGNFIENLRQFANNNAERVTLNGTKLKFIGVPVIQ